MSSILNGFRKKTKTMVLFNFRFKIINCLLSFALFFPIGSAQIVQSVFVDVGNGRSSNVLCTAQTAGLSGSEDINQQFACAIAGQRLEGGPYSFVAPSIPLGMDITNIEVVFYNSVCSSTLDIQLENEMLMLMVTTNMPCFVNTAECPTSDDRVSKSFNCENRAEGLVFGAVNQFDVFSTGGDGGTCFTHVEIIFTFSECPTVSIADLCSCDDPQNILDADGSILYFHDVLSFTGIGDIVCTSNCSGYLASDGTPITISGTSPSNIDIWRVPGAYPISNFTVGGLVAKLEADNCIDDCCPDLSTPPTMEIANSTCDVFGGDFSGGLITYGTCPEGSTIMYSTDGETYSSTPITYDQANPIDVYIRCECENENGQPNIITTNPGICPDPYFGVTNNFDVVDPCICNGDQGDNNQAGDGTFNETVTITGPTGLMVRVASETNGAITANTLMTETPIGSGSYILNFDHQDRLGFNITLFEWSADGGVTWNTATDASMATVMISNVCAYPVLGSNLEQSTCNIYGDIELATLISLNTTIDNPSLLYTPAIPAGLSFTIDGVTATSLDPSSLSIGIHTLVTSYAYDNGLGDGGNSANPAIGLDNSNCPVMYTQTFEIVECEPIPTLGEWGIICLSLILLIFGVKSIELKPSLIDAK